jgi:hypothetical protein
MATERQYLDIFPSQLSDAANRLLEAQRRTYEADKQARKALLAQIQADTPLGNGVAILGVHFTRWGQMQVSIGERQAKASTAKYRPSLSDYLAQQAASGRE